MHWMVVLYLDQRHCFVLYCTLTNGTALSAPMHGTMARSPPESAPHQLAIPPPIENPLMQTGTSRKRGCVRHQRTSAVPVVVTEPGDRAWRAGG
jgi:hypothetical protein